MAERNYYTALIIVKGPAKGELIFKEVILILVETEMGTVA